MARPDSSRKRATARRPSCRPRWPSKLPRAATCTLIRCRTAAASGCHGRQGSRAAEPGDALHHRVTPAVRGSVDTRSLVTPRHLECTAARVSQDARRVEPQPPAATPSSAWCASPLRSRAAVDRIDPIPILGGAAEASLGTRASGSAVSRWSRRWSTAARSSSTSPAAAGASDTSYVVRTADGLVVKRAGREPSDACQFVSDNPNKHVWPRRPWPPDAAVIGEVKWAARTFA